MLKNTTKIQYSINHGDFINTIKLPLSANIAVVDSIETITSKLLGKLLAYKGKKKDLMVLIEAFDKFSFLLEEKEKGAYIQIFYYP